MIILQKELNKLGMVYRKKYLKHIVLNTVYTRRVQVEQVYKLNPIFEAKNTTFL